MTGDDAGPGVRGERDDAVSGFSQDGADLLTTHDALKEEKRQKAPLSRREKIDGRAAAAAAVVGAPDAGTDCV